MFYYLHATFDIFGKSITNTNFEQNANNKIAEIMKSTTIIFIQF